MTPEPLSLRRIGGQTFRILGRDLPLITAVSLPLCALGVFAALWIRTWLPDAKPARLTADVAPWLAQVVATSLTDAALVWLALRRLSGGHGPRLGGATGVLITLGVVLGIDLVENITNLASLLTPAPASDTLALFYDLAILIAGAFWSALWFPAVAIAVGERLGGPTSLGRSLGLVAGNLRVLVVFALTVEIAERILGDGARLALTAMGYGGAPGWILDFIVLPIGAFASLSQAVVYWDLTRLKTGAEPVLATAGSS